MSGVRYSTRALLSGMTALRGMSRMQVRTACHNCSCGKRSLSLAAVARQQAAVPEPQIAGSSVMQAVTEKEYLRVRFGDGSKAKVPYVWLRDNCQCSVCFNQHAQGRKLIITDLDLDIYPTEVQESDSGLKVTWNDGHCSQFQGQWLHDRAFTTAARDHHRNRYACKREPWGPNHKLHEFDYNDMKKDDVLLNWLKTMEVHGSAMIKNAPEKDIAGPEIIEHIAYVKPSHYGPHSPVINRPNSNNLAFTNVKLGMHNDLPQYEHMPGIIFIHCLKQHEGTGGESMTADGLYGAELLRKNHPMAFNILASTDIYFWDKGHGNFAWEMEDFHKISKFPVITVNNNNEVIRVAVNNAVRDSHMDIPPESVKNFYWAFKIFNEILYDNSLNFKMDSGDIMTLDNVRCLHGREGYEALSERHIESSYLDWDEARCRRRRLQEKLHKE
ncbi:hypothetical protein Pmani_021442 [Petrolisthes manimaculis]|uniref:Gamma-butyrobetaine dioxygenase n=1 Tax=Petrolisthes manimaculis TaxID=1843537 RepID=A0AAE1U5B0_9EUCA|nr:hypothetical protein Pmani_021442 [Petrolisthes manimaculis]